MERVAELLPDEGHQLVGEAQLPCLDHPGGHIAAQRDDALDAGFAVALEGLAERSSGRRHAGDVRGDLLPLGLDLERHAQGAVARRAAGAEGHGEERRMELRELPAGDAQLLEPFGRLGREQLEAESAA